MPGIKINHSKKTSAMTVQELINELSAIKDKDMQVKFEFFDGDSPDITVPITDVGITFSGKTKETYVQLS